MNTTQHARSLLATTFSQGLQQALHKHRTFTETRAEQSIKDGSAVGLIEIAGSGECVAEIKFPISFLEKPTFTAGLELPDNVWLQWGTFPTWSATVGAWTTAPAQGAPLYVGALVGIVVAGVPRATLHYQFAARSYSNPVLSAESLGAPM